MTFYFRLPTGNISCEELWVACKKRLDFLSRVVECKGNFTALKAVFECDALLEDSEYLIEGTVKDVVSHFITRLSCSHSSDMYSFFREAEAALFSFRLQSMSENEFCALLKTTRRELLLHSRSSPSAVVDGAVRAKLLLLLEQLPPRDFAASAFGRHGNEHVLAVPFEDALSLVAARSVTLRRGVATVPCSSAFGLLVDYFDCSLAAAGARHCAHACAAAAASEDHRLTELFQNAQERFRRIAKRWASERALSGGCGSIMSEEVDHVAAFFPPCMRNLHVTLRRKHRLKHHSRISYTLFLKNIGLSVQESLKFWQEEYSKPCKYNSPVKAKAGGGVRDIEGCTHNWCASGKRYTYGIRHLYGLEGSKKNYGAQSCCHLQESISHGDDGGCPFRHFDRERLAALLEADFGLSADGALVVYKTLDSGDCRLACSVYCEKRNAVLLGVKMEASDGHGSMARAEAYSSSAPMVRLTSSGSKNTTCEDVVSASSSRSLTSASFIHCNSPVDFYRLLRKGCSRGHWKLES